MEYIPPLSLPSLPISVPSINTDWASLRWSKGTTVLVWCQRLLLLSRSLLSLARYLGRGEMAVSPILIGRVVVLIFLCMVAEGRSGCNKGNAGLHCSTYRPLIGSEKPSPVYDGVFKSLRPLVPQDGGVVLNQELRLVPSGPDPMHHNSSPKNKKPQTP